MYRVMAGGGFYLIVVGLWRRRADTTQYTVGCANLVFGSGAQTKFAKSISEAEVNASGAVTPQVW